MADNKVNFLRGTSTEYEAAIKDNDTFYYTTDDEKLYLGNKEITGGGGTSDVTKEYVDAQDATNLNLAKAYTDNAKSELQTTIDTVNDTLNTHVADQVKHITAEERAAWNAKAETDTATTTADGLMSAADKKKLDGIATGANKYSLPLATASVRGGAKIGYEENGKNYPVELSNEKMFVNVPWENTTYTTFVKSGSGAKSGLVPAPSTTAGTTKYLREDGTWAVPPDTTYSAATTSAAGLMSAADKTKLNGIATGANKYTLPTASSSTLGGVKTSSTVTSSSGYTACPIISGVPYYKDTNKTYSTATSSENGLMSSGDKKKLDGIYSGATPVTIRTGIVPKDGATNDTVSLAYISGRKNALVMIYLHKRISDLNNSAFDSILLTGISNSMTASSSNINIGSNTGCEVAISTKGVITLKPYPGATASQRYIVIYYN